MRFRRISFPVSALLSIAAIALFFFHGLNFGIDFVGGTLMEVQTKAGPADLSQMRSTIGSLQLGDFPLQQVGAPDAALLRILGYSLNATGVIYDRIGEMLRRYKRMPIPDLLNASVNATLSRSIVAHVSVAMSRLALLLFGGQAIHSFTGTTMLGVVLVGT